MRDTTVNNIFISDGEGYLGNQEYNFMGVLFYFLFFWQSTFHTNVLMIVKVSCCKFHIALDP